MVSFLFSLELSLLDPLPVRSGPLGCKLLASYVLIFVVLGLGIQTTFTAIASVQVAICCLSIPMCKSSLVPYRPDDSVTCVQLTRPFSSRRLRQEEQELLCQT